MIGRIGNAAQNDILLLLLQNTAIANIGNTAGLQPSSAAGSLWVALHTADPGAGGTQATNEAAYSGYSRVAVARSSAGFTVSSSSPTIGENAAQVTFGAGAVGISPETETWFSVGYQSTGATKYLYAGPLGVSTTVASASSGTALPTGTITVGSTTGFAASGTFTVQTDAGSETVTYTGLTSTTFTGCTGGTGHLYTGSPVFQAQTITVSGGITPSFAIGAITTTLD